MPPHMEKIKSCHIPYININSRWTEELIFLKEKSTKALEKYKTLLIGKSFLSKTQSPEAIKEKIGGFI